MARLFSALIAGVVFGAGLALSDMINPARVLAFLNVAGAWDPTLAYVMGGAVVVAALAYLIAPRMKRPLFAGAFLIPENRVIERRLVFGSILFGLGWGLVGLCPGPALAALVFGLWQLWLFVAAMLGGMLLHRVVTSSRLRTARAVLHGDA